MSVQRLFYYSIVSISFLAVVFLNAYWWRSERLGGPLLLFFLLFYGYEIGRRYLHHPSRSQQLLIGIVILLAVFSIYGTVVFYAFALTKTAAILGLILFVLWLPFRSLREKGLTSNFHDRENLKSAPSPSSCPLTLATGLWLSGTVLFLATLSIIWRAEILTPIRSPWLVIPPIFFLLILLLASLAFASRSKILFVYLFFILVSVAWLAYPLGYGFDPFIHQATEQYIADHGTIAPKPPYYVGQYALVVQAERVFSLPIETIDGFLVPFFFVLIAALAINLLPAATSAFALFLLPLSSFIMTTPQGLANSWLILTVLTTATLGPGLRLPALFTASALAAHPLAGLPAALFLVILHRYQKGKTTLKKNWPLLIGGAIFMPVIFFIFAWQSGQTAGFYPSLPSLSSVLNTLDLYPFLQNRFEVWKDLLYLFGWNRIILISVIAVIGLWLGRRTTHRPMLLAGLTASLLMLINYLILDQFFDFSFLIDYERGVYAERLFEIVQFFTLPLLFIAFDQAFKRLADRPIVLRAGFIVISAVVAMAAVYHAYPRHDQYEISRGFNVGVSDFAAVEYIHEQQRPGTYVVLANQAVSAAALKKYGFETYFKNEIFAYPIPTGGPLYKLYLKMVNEGPARETAKAAMDLTGVETAYFVVNDYWFQAEKIIENAKRQADDWMMIDQGAIYVFLFNRD